MKVKATNIHENEQSVGFIIIYHYFLFRTAAIDLSGLGSLTWLKDKIDSWIVGHLRSRALAALKNTIERAFKEIIPLINLEALLDD